MSPSRFTPIREFLEAHATVAFLEPKQGMGLTFRDMPEYFSGILNKWLTEAKKRKPN